MRWVACFLGLLTLAAGCVLEEEPVIPADGGVEAGMCGLCPVDTPICNDDFECVECDTSSDCTAADAARCLAKECEPCNAHAQCSDIDDLWTEPNLCDEGVCVDCTPETEASTCPDGDSCNPITNACSGIQPGTRANCQLCVSDRDCGEVGNRCVPMTYDGEPFPDDRTGFCLKTTQGGCDQPYSTTLFNRPSLSGPPVDDYCGINEALATCPAVRALELNLLCNEGTDDECPQPSGLCRQVGNLMNRCTFHCSDLVECKEPFVAGWTCGPGAAGGSDGAGGADGAGGGDYCGG